MSDNYDNKKKDRSQQPEQDQKDPNNKKTYSFKINLNFIYLLIGMLLLGLMFFNDDSSSQREITYGEFQQYVRNGYVNRVVGYDDNTVEAYIIFLGYLLANNAADILHRFHDLSI